MPAHEKRTALNSLIPRGIPIRTQKGPANKDADRHALQFCRAHGMSQKAQFMQFAY